MRAALSAQEVFVIAEKFFTSLSRKPFVLAKIINPKIPGSGCGSGFSPERTNQINSADRYKLAVFDSGLATLEGAITRKIYSLEAMAKIQSQINKTLCTSLC
jgi:hypothetical protein